MLFLGFVLPLHFFALFFLFSFLFKYLAFVSVILLPPFKLFGSPSIEAFAMSAHMYREFIFQIFISYHCILSRIFSVTSISAPCTHTHTQIHNRAGAHIFYSLVYGQLCSWAVFGEFVDFVCYFRCVCVHASRPSPRVYCFSIPKKKLLRRAPNSAAATTII